MAIAALIALLGAFGAITGPASAQTRWRATAASASGVCAGTLETQREPGRAGVEYRRGVVLIAFRRGIPGARQAAIERAAGACATRALGPSSALTPRATRRGAQPLAPIELRVPASRVLAIVARLRRRAGVAYAEPDYVTHASAVPNDQYFSKQWGDENVGQQVPLSPNEGVPSGELAPGTPGADDNVTAAWDLTTGSSSVVIGEVDTGVEYEHPDLGENVWTNPAASVGGCPSGTRGFDVLPENKTPCDPQDDDESYGGHGTHVAGIMGAVGDNGIGVAGVNWHTSILPVKWLNSAGSGSTAELVEALKTIALVWQEGVNVRVVNDSDTFPGPGGGSTALKEEIEALGKDGILFVTAAGNTAQNNDTEPRYPCDYSLPNEICVTASDDNDKLPSWANYGQKKVDLAAPGVSIYSTLRKSGYGYLSGGSMASPQVAGTAALVLSVEPKLSPEALKADIVGNVDKLASLSGKVNSGGRLDVCRAIPGCGSGISPPSVETGYASVTQTAATLKGSVNPGGQQVTSCRFEYGASGSYGSSAACVPAEPGSGKKAVAVSASVSGLEPGTLYHFRLVAGNSAGSAHGEDQTFTTAAATVPPSVETSGYASVTQTAATLKGSVDPGGHEVTSCRFEYGASGAYGSSAACVPAEPGSGTKAVAVSASVSGLEPGTLYHFRLVAGNSAGSAHGEDQTFTTTAPPSAVTLEATSATPSSETVAGSVNPNGAEVTRCAFKYGTSPSYGSTAACSTPPGAGTQPVRVGATLTGLAPNTTYHYRLFASNAEGERSGEDRTFTTSSIAVVTQGFSLVTQTTATLEGSVNPQGEGVTNCHFEYGGSGSYGSSAACSPSEPGSGTSAVAVSAAIAGLAPGTSIHFRLVAGSAAGEVYGADQSFATLAAPPRSGETMSPPPLTAGLPASVGVLPLQESKPPAPLPDAVLASTALAAAQSGSVSVKIDCPVGESSCTGALTLRTLSAVSIPSSGTRSKARKAILTLAVVDFTVVGGQVKRLSAHLYSAARALLRRTHLLHVRATIVAHDARGATGTTHVNAILRAPPRRP